MVGTLLKLSPRLRLVIRRRKFTVAVEDEVPTQKLEKLSKSRSFEEMPEAKGLPLIGTILDYTPFRGFKASNIHKLWARRHEQYGDIYREKSPSFKGYMVFCRAREDTEVMLRSEARTPFRPPLDAVIYSKEICDLPQGIGSLNGSQWYKQRQIINRPLLMNKMVWKYLRKQHEVSKDLMKYIHRHLNDRNEVNNFDSVLGRWAFEMSGTVLLGCRLGLLSDSPDPVMMELFDGTNVMMDFIANSFAGFNLWKYMETRESAKLKASVTHTYKIMSSIISQTENESNLDGTVLGEVLGAKNLRKREKLTLLNDVLGASIETTAKAAALIIYCLTRYPEVQEKLREEILTLPNDEQLTGRVLESMKYMNAFIKEAVRLYPVSFGQIREFEKEIVLSGYRIPAGTIVINTSNSSQNRNPHFFPEPNKFIPERWMGNEEESKKFIMTGPFSTGARACPGRRFAMQEIRLLLLELLQNFKMEYHYKPIESVFRATGCPSEEARFTFVPRNSYHG